MENDAKSAILHTVSGLPRTQSPGLFFDMPGVVFPHLLRSIS
jgi:hypothetical protein